MNESSERALIEWLRDGPDVGPLEPLDAALARAHLTRQRPAWAFPERWIPMDLTMRAPLFPRAVRYLVLLAILAIVAVAAAFLIGGPRQPVLQPFGPAANGVVVAGVSGDLVTTDPATGTVKTIVGGPEIDRLPAFSRDGTRIAFVRGGDAVFVVDAFGGGLRRLTNEPVSTPTALVWSPDGSNVAFLAGEHIWIAATNGSGARQLDLSLSAVFELAWRPPDGRELVFVGRAGGMMDLYRVHPDGSSLQRITRLDGVGDAFVWMTISADGRQVAFGMYPERQVHVVDIDLRRDEVIKPVDGMGLNFPRWSPDGKKIAVLQVPANGSTRIGVFDAGEPSPTIVATGPEFAFGVQHEWSPDGRSILAVDWSTGKTWLLDPGGGPGRQVAWTIPQDFIQWQRLSP